MDFHEILPQSKKKKKTQILKHLSNEISLFWVLHKYGVCLYLPGVCVLRCGGGSVSLLLNGRGTKPMIESNDRVEGFLNKRRQKYVTLWSEFCILLLKWNHSALIL